MALDKHDLKSIQKVWPLEMKDEKCLQGVGFIARRVITYMDGCRLIDTVMLGLQN